MALKSDTNYYSNAFAGTPFIGDGVDILETNSNPKFAVGFGFERADGSKYRYVQYGGTVVAGNVVCPTTDSNLVKDLDNKVINSTTAVAVTGELLKPGLRGSKFVQLGTTTAINEWAGGYLIITDGPGIGHTYRIKGNRTPVASASTVMIELCDPLCATVDSTTDIAIRGSLWSDLIQAGGSAQYRHATGIACAGGSDGRYGWVCTRGVTAVTQEVTLVSVAGMGLIVSSNTAGAVQYANNYNWATLANYQVVGTCLDIGDSAGCSTINVSIE